MDSDKRKDSTELLEALKEVQSLKLTQVKKKHKPRRKGKKRLSRSWYGDLLLIIFLLAFGLFSAYPLVYTFANAFKPASEMFIFPPQLFPNAWTIENFTKLTNLVGDAITPISRYLINTLFITILGVVGHIFFAALCAYPLAKYKYPGKRFINQLIVYSLMFTPAVTTIPTYLIVTSMGLFDSLWAIIIPAWGYTLGLYLMRQFMTSIPDELLEAAKIDGASEIRIFFQIVMPIVRPAWLTVLILLFQNLWSQDGSLYIHSENLKPLSYALQQIVNSGVARAGESAAVGLIMMAVPVTIFIFSQTKIVDTMAHSGLK